MTAKEYLDQAHHLDKLIKCRLRERDYWRDLSYSIGGGGFEAHYNPNHATEAPFVRCIERIDEIEREINKKVDQLIKLRKDINARIDMLDNREEQILLRYRYLDNFTWEQIESMMNVSERTMFRIHVNALKHFSVPD